MIVGALTSATKNDELTRTAVKGQDHAFGAAIGCQRLACAAHLMVGACQHVKHEIIKANVIVQLLTIKDFYLISLDQPHLLKNEKISFFP